MFRILAAAFAFCLLAPAASAAPVVTVDSGALSGANAGGVDVYKGIPYAAPPVGPLRWMPPAPPASWHGTRDATAYGAICPQPKRPDGALAAGAGLAQSEDCLSLNVWTPAGAHHAPVMVWIHGGAHRFGSGASPLYDGTRFAQDGVVLVTLNYRLGLLGFFAHPALTNEAGADAPLGNYGLMDQRAALQWVQRNIAAFGGDPSNVTVFGESAGGVDILYHLTAPSSRGLFAKAIVESGGGWGRGDSLADKEKDGADFAGAGATPDQLRAIPVEKTLSLPAALGFGPFVDGRFVVEAPQHAFAQGHQQRVPLIIGSNSFEASLMQSFAIPPERFLSRMTPALRAAYAKAGNAGSDEALAQAVFTDSVMGAPAHWIAGKAAAGAPAYLYHFSYVASMQRGRVAGARHGSEIPFVFATGDAIAARFGITISPDDGAMENLMHSCWVGFARTGAPQCAGQTWPAYTPARDELLEFGTSSGPVAHFREDQYDALEAALTPD